MKANWWQTIFTWVFVIVGWILLLFVCIAKGWTSAQTDSNKPWPSGKQNIGPYRPKIDRWKWEGLNTIYGNPEDGVSGQQAFVWNSTGTEVVPYMPGASAWWRAYCWSAWRNSTDQLKYRWGKT